MKTLEKIAAMTDNQLTELLEKLKTHLTPQRWETIENNSRKRTRYLAVILENIHYTQNMSAVIRTSDCMGLQDLYIVGQTNNPRVNKGVALGASNWVNVNRDTRRPAAEALQAIKDKGYLLVATLPREDALELKDLDIGRGKMALMFGQEICGLSPEAIKMADIAVKIPMYGFSESYNISVSAGICLYELKKKLMDSNINWRLSPREILELQYKWTKQSIRHGDLVEQNYEADLEHPNAQ